MMLLVVLVAFGGGWFDFVCFCVIPVQESNGIIQQIAAVYGMYTEVQFGTMSTKTCD